MHLCTMHVVMRSVRRFLYLLSLHRWCHVVVAFIRTKDDDSFIHSFSSISTFNTSKKDLMGVTIAPTVRLFNGQISNLRYVNTSTETNVLLLIAS